MLTFWHLLLAAAIAFMLLGLGVLIKDFIKGFKKGYKQ